MPLYSLYFPMKKCNLCGFPVLKIYKGVFGLRCLRCGSTYIHRAIGLIIQEIIPEGEISVYEMSSSGALFRFMRRRYKDFTCSEFYEDVIPGASKEGVQCQDVQNLTFGNESFDLVTSTEVFEHVPDDLKGFKEIYRVLKMGGYFIFTVPLSDSEKTVERAFIKDGRVEHRVPPEYHGDRIRGQNRVLTFRNYGMDIRFRLESIGFEVDFRVINDERHAIANGRVIVCKKSLRI